MTDAIMTFTDPLEYLPLLFQLQKENTEEYIDYLISIGWLDEAAIRLADIINDETFVSKDGKSKHQVGWTRHVHTVHFVTDCLVLNTACKRHS